MICLEEDNASVLMQNPVSWNKLSIMSYNITRLVNHWQLKLSLLETEEKPYKKWKLSQT